MTYYGQNWQSAPKFADDFKKFLLDKNDDTSGFSLLLLSPIS